MIIKQAEKLKSREMKEGWMKSDEGWMKNDERWMMKDEGCWFQAVEGFCWWTDGRTDICDCRVAFATEKILPFSCIIPYLLVVSRVLFKIFILSPQQINRKLTQLCYKNSFFEIFYKSRQGICSIYFVIKTKLL